MNDNDEDFDLAYAVKWWRWCITFLVVFWCAVFGGVWAAFKGVM